MMMIWVPKCSETLNLFAVSGEVQRIYKEFEQLSAAMRHEVAHGTSFTTSSRRLSSFGPIGPHMLYMVNAQMGQQVLT